MTINSSMVKSINYCWTFNILIISKVGFCSLLIMKKRLKSPLLITIYPYALKAKILGFIIQEIY